MPPESSVSADADSSTAAQYSNRPDAQQSRLALAEVSRSGMPQFDQGLRQIRIEVVVATMEPGTADATLRSMASLIPHDRSVRKVDLVVVPDDHGAKRPSNR